VGANASERERPQNMTRSITAGNDETIIFRNHHGSRYVWPYELCRSFDVRKVGELLPTH
jgi:hypothetical protein